MPLFSPLFLLFHLSLFFRNRSKLLCSTHPRRPLLGQRGSPLVDVRRQGSSEPLLFVRSRTREGWAGRAWESTRDGGLGDAIHSLSQSVGTLHTCPADPGGTNSFRSSVSPFLEEERGAEKTKGSKREKGKKASLCTPELGWQKGARRSRRGSGNVPRRIASKLSILPRSISSFLRPPPAQLVGSGGGEGPRS